MKQPRIMGIMIWYSIKYTIKPIKYSCLNLIEFKQTFSPNLELQKNKG